MAEKRHVRVMVLDPKTNEKKPLAEFELDGDKMRAAYHSPHFKMSMNKTGVPMGKKTFHPWDKGEFLDALELAYSKSSNTFVEQVG